MKKIILTFIAATAIGLMAGIMNHQSRQSYNVTTSQDQMAAMRTEQVLDNLNLIASR